MCVNDKWQTFLSGQCRMSFSEYMEMALYGPDGYYSKDVQIGGAGRDFFTSASFSLFAKSLAQSAYQAWHAKNCPARLQVVEWGAGEGHFAKTFIPALLAKLDGQASLTYVIEEKSEELRRRQQDLLQTIVSQLAESNGQLRFGTTLPNAPLTIVIGNEVLDALSVERMHRSSLGWQRCFVQMDPETQCLTSHFQNAPQVLVNLAEKFLPIPIGQLADIAPDDGGLFQTCTNYSEEVLGWFFDYGMHRVDFENGLRPQGTLRAFKNHEHLNVFETPLGVDITADVVWECAAEMAKQAGFTNIRIESQQKFLMQAQITDEFEQWVRDCSILSVDYIKRANELKQLLFPGGLGERFEVLCLEKSTLFDVSEGITCFES